MSSTQWGTKRRGGGRTQHHQHLHENWTIKAKHNKPKLHEQQESNTESSSIPSTSFQQQQSPKTYQDPNWVPPNEPNHSSKQQTLENFEVGSSNRELDNKEKDDGGSNKTEKENVIDGYETGDDEVVDDVENLLEKLRLGVEEPELSEEQLKINDQLQEDELLAMKSIYGENVFILDKKGSLRCFQILIHIEAPGGLTVTAKLNSSGDFKMKSESDYSYSIKVQYLPPIVLTFLLPKSYPSHLPPYFTISVQWLDSIRISTLCSMLDTIWMEQPGQEVIYQCVEWLQNSSLSHLEADQEITLGPYDIEHSKDMRAVSGSVSFEVDIPSLRSYNDEQCHENFRQNLHECPICYDEYTDAYLAFGIEVSIEGQVSNQAGRQRFHSATLPALFCCTCMKTYSDIHVTEGTVHKLKCPDAKCGRMVPPGFLKRLLGDEEYERWESLMLQKTLDAMSDVTYCLRCETPCIEDEDQHAQCSKCLFSFCTICRERRHVGESCLTPEQKLRVLEERQNSSQLKDKQKLREREMINELLSLKEISRDAKQCPSCNMAISRIEGCNKMVCKNCGQYFCYLCNKAIDGYDHFRDGCELFPRQEIDRQWERQWERQMNARQIAAQVQAELFADHAHRCPNCGQGNAKVGNNNHMFCWACQNHYCYLCKKIVRRSAQHFRPKGCKQHTPG